MPLNAAGSYATKHSAHLANFFDSDKIMKAVDKGIRKQLGWFGGYVRKASMNSLKDVPNAGSPGNPPHVHTVYLKKHTGKKGKNRVKLTVFKARSLFKDSILYSYNAKAQEVIIGPFLFKDGDASNPVPGLLEKGGVTRKTIKSKTGKTRVKISRYPARPYMRPAFERSLIQFRKRLINFVTKR